MRSMLAAILMFLTVSSTYADEAAPGVWSGTMDVGVRTFRFRVEPVDVKDVASGHQLVSLDEGGQIFRLDDFLLDDSTLSFQLKQTKAAFSGKRSDDRGTVTGKWKQAGGAFDLVLKHFDKAPVEAPTEVWTGKLSTLLQKLDVRVRVYQQADGTEQVRFDSVSQKTGGFKAIRKVEGQKWTIEVKVVGGVFAGTANATGTEVKGTWTQGGAPLDLTLIREMTPVPEVAPVVLRPQTPLPPFPYAIEEVSFVNSAEGLTLAGTLTLPKTGSSFGAAILISGSGPQDRDESLLEHKPFWIIADHLTRNGIAVLRFDDRGTAGSTGNFAQATSENFANDVEAALEFLRKDQRIDPRRIGLIGHSEGGLVAPLVAARRKDVAFIVLLAGPGVNGREILLSQGQLILKAEGVTDEAALKAQRETQLAIMEAVISAPQDAAHEAMVEAAFEKLKSVLPPETTQQANLKQALGAGISQFKTPWFRFFLTHEPGPVLEQVTCPVFAINGEKDVQVDPQLNLPAIRAALEKGGNSHFEILELPGLNHLFQTCKTGGVSEYQAIEETISPLALERMTTWILTHLSQP